MNKTRYIPEGYTMVKQTNLGVVYRKDDIILGFSGKRSTNDFHYRMTPSTSEMLEVRITRHIKEFFEKLEAYEDRKRARAAERKNKVLDVKVGDIFYSSWGYDQTNVDFYQVTRVVGKSFYIKEINGKYADGESRGSMSAYVLPVKDSFKGEEILKHGFNMKWGYLSKTDETTPHYCSWYH